MKGEVVEGRSITLKQVLKLRINFESINDCSEVYISKLSENKPSRIIFFPCWNIQICVFPAELLDCARYCETYPGAYTYMHPCD